MTSSASVGRERRQDPRQPSREHRLARPGRAGRAEVVTARGRDLERAPCPLLTSQSARSRTGACGSWPFRGTQGRRVDARRADRRPPPRDAARAPARSPRAPPRARTRAAQSRRGRPASTRALRERRAHRRRAADGRRARAPRRPHARPARRAGSDRTRPGSTSAIGRSNPDPSFRSAAGARLTVIRRSGHSSSAEAIPLRTRSFASWQARSARPTIANAGHAALQVRLDLDAAGLEADERVRDGAREHPVHATAQRVSRVCAELCRKTAALAGDEHVFEELARAAARAPVHVAAIARLEPQARRARGSPGRARGGR